MKIIDDDIALTGDRIITKDTKGEYIVKYIIFTATSVSESSELSVKTDVDKSVWDVRAEIVRCTDDQEGNTYAVRVTCPYYYVYKKGMNMVDNANTRTVKVSGKIRTNDINVFSSVHEKITVVGCMRSRIPNESDPGYTIYGDNGGVGYWGG